MLLLLFGQLGQFGLLGRLDDLEAASVGDVPGRVEELAHLGHAPRHREQRLGVADELVDVPFTYK